MTANLRVASLNVTGLFGLYDHVVELKTHERVTIIHGPLVGEDRVCSMLRACTDAHTVTNSTTWKELTTWEAAPPPTG